MIGVYLILIKKLWGLWARLTLGERFQCRPHIDFFVRQLTLVEIDRVENGFLPTEL